MMQAVLIFTVAFALAASITAALYLRRIDTRLATAQAAPVCTLTDMVGPAHAAAYGEIARKLNGHKAVVTKETK
jgi:hypothetical protein